MFLPSTAYPSTALPSTAHPIATADQIRYAGTGQRTTQGQTCMPTDIWEAGSTRCMSNPRVIPDIGGADTCP
eukprot:922979-Rhodomonas_salina.1